MMRSMKRRDLFSLAVAGLISVALKHMENGDVEKGKAVLERLYSDLSGETEGLE